MFTKKTALASFFVLAMTSTPLSVSAAPIAIDEFSTQQLLIAKQGETKSSEATDPTAIGGVRRLTLINTRAPSDQLGSTASVSLPTAEEELGLSNDTGAASILHVDWDRGGAGLGGIDLTGGGGNDFFTVDLAAADNEFSLSFEVTDIFDRDSSITRTISSLSGLDPLTLLVPISLFDGAADFTAVDSIRMTLASITNNLDLAITGVGVTPGNTPEVPLPGAIPLMISGLTGLALAFRRSPSAGRSGGKRAQTT